MNETMKRIISLALLLLVLLLVAGNAYFIVNEGEQAIVTRFGRVLPNNYVEAGLKFKLPFFDIEHKYPKKLLSWDGQADLLPTSDDKRVLLDTTARWRIADPKVFYAKLADTSDAFNKLDDIIDKRVRAVIGRYPMVEIVRANNEMISIAEKKEWQDSQVTASKSSEKATSRDSDEAPLEGDSPELNDEMSSQPQGLADHGADLSLDRATIQAAGLIKVERGRLVLEQEILEFSRQEINPQSLGIELVDVLIRQVQYPDNVAAKVYERMASERKKRAAEQRSRGEGQKAYWLGRLGKEKQTIIAQAESKAAAIYREAYDKDPEFYRFWRAMDSYGATISDTDKIISTDMAYFDYLYSPRGQR